MKYRIIIKLDAMANKQYIPQYKTFLFWHIYKDSYDDTKSCYSLDYCERFLIGKYQEYLKRKHFKKQVIEVFIEEVATKVTEPEEPTLTAVHLKC
jgi:hypothetical protein